MKLSEALKNGSAILLGDHIEFENEKVSTLIVDIEVKGYLDCHNNRLTELIINQPIGGYLDCYNNRLTDLIINQPIGGSLYCDYNELTELEINQPIGGNLDCSNNQLTKLEINQPIEGYLYCYDNRLKEKPTFERLNQGDLGKDWLYVDGILSHYHKVKKMGGITFYIGFKYTVAKQGEFYAHGKNIKDALLDLRFKMVERDKSDYEVLTLESVLSYEDAIVMYRVITGACKQGTQDFLQNNSIEEKDYSVKEIIDLTKGQYGSDYLIGFIGGK